MENPSDTLEKFTLRKAELECKKLEVEIENSSLLWWKKPGYLAGATPIVIALVGFLTAVMAGYFDDRKAILEASIGNLKNQEKTLEEKILGMQNSIDRAYINLKVAQSNANYATSHLGVCGSDLTPAEKAALNDAIPPKNLLDRLTGCLSTTLVIRQASKEIMAELNEHLEKVPASVWAKELTPEIGPQSILRAQDGTIYHPETGKFYQSVEALNKRLN